MGLIKKLILLLFLFPSLLFASDGFKIKEINKLEGIDLRNDKKVSFTFSKEQTSVVYFLSSQCPCSQGHFDHLNSLQKKYSDLNYNFIALHSNKSISKESASKYFAKFKIDFPIILDKDLKYANGFSAVKTPHVFVLNKGELVFQGGVTNSMNPKRATNFYLQDALEALSGGKEPLVKNAKTIGCYIKR